MGSHKKVSANFAVFIISFLIFSTVIVFAVLLFLSYENMYNNLIIECGENCQNATISLVEDCDSIIEDSEKFQFTLDNDGTDNLDKSLMIIRFVESKIYRDNSIYLVDEDGMVLTRNQLIGDGKNQIKAERGNDGRYYIVDEEVLEFLPMCDDENISSNILKQRDYISSVCCLKMKNADIYCIVKTISPITPASEEFISTILVPALIAMLIAIALYVGFVWISLRPVKEISSVISRVSEGDYSARVDSKYANAGDFSNMTISTEFTEMASTVNTMIESLQNQEKDRKLFISSIAHDIRTPLTSINGFVTAMLDGTIPADKNDKYFNLIKQEINRIRTLVVSMTEASSLAHVDPEMMEEFDTTEMIVDIIENLESQLKEKDIRIVKSLEEQGTAIAYGDGQQLCRVVMNIITNAIKFTPVGGVIKITTEVIKRENKILVSVEDSGPGIDENKRKRIFDSFYQADSSRKQEGFGLGLYICKQILAGHGQTIVCNESHEFGGAKFDFTLGMPAKKES